MVRLPGGQKSAAVHGCLPAPGPGGKGPSKAHVVLCLPSAVQLLRQMELVL